MISLSKWANQSESHSSGRELLILEQVETLRTLACEVGLPVRFLKPHGALYNQAQFQEPVAQGVLLAAGRLDIPLLGQPGTLLERLAKEQGVCYIPEGFPDRRYRAPGRWFLAPSPVRSFTTRAKSSSRSSGWSRRDGWQRSAFMAMSQRRWRMRISSGESSTATESRSGAS